MKHVFFVLAKYLFVLALAMAPILSEAQSINFTIKGTVTDENGEPLTGVTVKMVETLRGALTDLSGNYQIESAAPEGEYTLTFDYVSYQSQRRKVALALGKSTIIENVSMGNDILSLDEVVVTGNSPTSTRRQLGPLG